MTPMVPNNDLHERVPDIGIARPKTTTPFQPPLSMMASTSTLYVPIASPPTPAPSPRLSMSSRPPFHADFTSHISHSPPHTPLPFSLDPGPQSQPEFASLASPDARLQYLSALLHACTPAELLFISNTIAPMLKRDFLRDLPTELALYVLGFVDTPKTLARAAQVSRGWRARVGDEWTWKRMCDFYCFDTDRRRVLARAGAADGEGDESGSGGAGAGAGDGEGEEPLVEMERFADYPLDPALQWLAAKNRKKHQQGSGSGSVSGALRSRELLDTSFSYRRYFQYSYKTMMNWRTKGQLLRTHRVPSQTPNPNPDAGVITSVALDADWVIVGLANTRIHVFSAKTGVLARTLVGHELGVWAVHLVSRGGSREEAKEARCGEEEEVPGLDHLVPPNLRAALGLDQTHPESEEGPSSDPASSSDEDEDASLGKRSDECNATEGWGQPSALVVSGGCDKVLRVWDVKAGYCIYVLHGHTSTIRCVKVLHNRPIAVSGSRDGTLRVWDVQRGKALRVLQGHAQSVRCLDVCGNKVVSGSYDTTLRLWNVDTGECLQILRGHFHQIYSVAFDGVRIASGGLDATVRVWSAKTGECIALLAGHSALVCQLQLGPGILATGGSDGRVITFSLLTYSPLKHIAAHESSVTSLQFDARFLVTGGNDGRVRLFETRTGNYVREMTEQCESVWKVMYKGETCAIMCRRAGKTVMEIWSFKPNEGG